MELPRTSTRSHGSGAHDGSAPCLQGERESRFNDGYLQHVKCRDPIEFNSCIRAWNWAVMLLERGDFSAEGATVSLGATRVARLRFNRSLLHRLEAPAGCTSLVLFGGGTGSVFVEGRSLARGDGVILRSGSRVEIVSQGESVAVAVSVSKSEWGRNAPFALGDGIPLRDGGELLACKPDSVLALLMGIDSVVDAFATRPDSLPSLVMQQSLSDLVLTLVGQLRAQLWPLVAERRKGARRRIGVERAREYIVNHFLEPISLADLSRHTHLQPRSLEYGFSEIVGLSPVSYIKMLRLGEAHRRLLSRAYACLSISEIALDSGFCHLSQFAVDYKRLFMESPSATRKRYAGTGPRIRPRRGSLPLPALDAKGRALVRETQAGWMQFARRAPEPISAGGN